MHRRILFLALAGAAIVACTREPPATLRLWFPRELQGLAIVDSIGGEAARATLERMHGSDVAPLETRIGVYGEGALPAVLYLSRYPKAEVAERERRAMTRRIGAGSSGFVPGRPFRVSGVEVHPAVGHGQAHYYFARGPELAWLSAEPDLAPAMLAELLGVPADSVSR